MIIFKWLFVAVKAIAVFLLKLAAFLLIGMLPVGLIHLFFWPLHAYGLMSDESYPYVPNVLSMIWLGIFMVIYMLAFAFEMQYQEWQEERGRTQEKRAVS